jgi:TonB family protein
VVLGGDGKVRDVRVARSLSPDSNQEAIEAIRRWIFQPARKNGQPVSVQLPSPEAVPNRERSAT